MGLGPPLTPGNLSPASTATGGARREAGRCYGAGFEAMNVNVGVRTAAALLDQFYEKRRLLIVSTPTARNLLYRLQLGVPQQAQCGLDLPHITVVELVGVFPTLIGRMGAKIMPPALALQLRLSLRIPLYSFSMVLVDKHGMGK